jgi:hypothetical protein
VDRITTTVRGPIVIGCSAAGGVQEGRRFTGAYGGLTERPAR